MENFDELLKKYADFIVRVGVNPQPGQTLIINCPLEGAPLARLCVRSVYEAGARDVQVRVCAASHCGRPGAVCGH